MLMLRMPFFAPASCNWLVSLVLYSAHKHDDRSVNEINNFLVSYLKYPQ